MTETVAVSPVAVSVVIPTYNRPDLLAAAVASVRAQLLPGVGFEIVVVDNSRDANAAAVVAALGQGPGPAVRYHAEPRPNIARARNAGIRAAAGRYVAFLDDDEVAEPGWLAALVATLEASGADAVFGRVVADFPAGAPDWDPDGRRFTRSLDRASGTPLTTRHDTALSGRWLGTGNSVMRVATCFEDPEPFDPRFGGSGGEDFDLLTRLERRGRRFAWCREAVVRELCPADRTTLAYMTYRSFRSGQTYAAVNLKNADRPAAAALDLLGRALAQIATLAPTLAVTSLLRLPSRHRARLRLAAASGRFCWWRLPRAYS